MRNERHALARPVILAGSPPLSQDRTSNALALWLAGRFRVYRVGLLIVAMSFLSKTGGTTGFTHKKQCSPRTLRSGRAFYCVIFIFMSRRKRTCDYPVKNCATHF